MVRVVETDDLVGQADLFEGPQDTQVAGVAPRAFADATKPYSSSIRAAHRERLRILFASDTRRYCQLRLMENTCGTS
jgi:hypothetical protein